METYQPIFDAVRSKIHNGDVGAAVQEAVSNANISFYASQALELVRCTMSEYERPSVLFRPTLTMDGSEWIALYGPNIQEGVVGCGDSPCAAMRDFDEAWYRKTKGGG